MAKKNYNPNLAFRLRNKEKFKEKIICPICGGKYVYFNKSHHNKSKKHLLVNKILEDNYNFDYKNELFFNDDKNIKNNNNSVKINKIDDDDDDLFK